jgi:hypothetical protein
MYRVYRLREGGTPSIVDVAPNVVAESYRISESRDSSEVSSMDEKINILMVDDKPGKLLSYEAILNELGEKLIKAHSGRSAIALIVAGTLFPPSNCASLRALSSKTPAENGFGAASRAVLMDGRASKLPQSGLYYRARWAGGQ